MKGRGGDGMSSDRDRQRDRERVTNTFILTYCPLCSAFIHLVLRT